MLANSEGATQKLFNLTTLIWPFGLKLGNTLNFSIEFILFEFF